MEAHRSIGVLSQRIFAAAVAVVMTTCVAGDGAAACGAKVKFAKGRTLSFPDFDLTYTGSRHESSSKFPRGFSFEEFTISRGGETKVVSWSSGTGDIGPVEFSFDGRKFALELRMSDKLGRLAQDELVVWRR